MKLIYHISILLLLIIGTSSCDRFGNKAEQVIQRTKEELKAQSNKAVQLIFPPFDYDVPDTENNKKRFSDFIKVKITADVTAIYCFDDAIGIDSDYMFSFNCNPITSDKIIAVHKLTIDTINPDNGFGLQHDFEWWDKEKIQKLQKYSWTDGNQYFKYYWYDLKNKKAYFFDFDM
jgi:hypothetical protein